MKENQCVHKLSSAYLISCIYDSSKRKRKVEERKKSKRGYEREKKRELSPAEGKEVAYPLIKKKT